MTRVLLTGAGGFVRALVVSVGERLGWPVTAADLRPVTVPGVETLGLDAASDAVVTRIAGGQFDVVLHQAPINDTADDRRWVMSETNVPLTRARSLDGTRFVFASSGSVSGAIRPCRPVPAGLLGVARWCSGPLNEYARSKLLPEQRTRQLGNDLSSTGWRYTNVSGPGEQHKGPVASVVSQMPRQAATGECADRVVDAFLHHGKSGDLADLPRACSCRPEVSPVPLDHGAIVGRGLTLLDRVNVPSAA